MPLDDTRANRSKAKTATKEAQHAAAWEYYEASLALRADEVRRTKAHAAAVKADVLPDHLKHPLPVGTNEVVYADSVLVISVTVFAPIVGVDHAGYVADLLKAGVKPALIKRLDKKHRTEMRPAHKFTASLVTA